MRYQSVNKTLGDLAGWLSEAGRAVEATGLLPASRAMALALLCCKLGAPLLILTENEKSARELYRDLDFFWPVENRYGLHFYPCLRRGFMTKEARVQRMEALEGLRRGSKEPTAVVAPLDAIYQYVPSRESFDELVFDISCGGQLDLDRLSESLYRAGYVRVDMVEEVGDYSVRGGIVDVFPPLAVNPVRVEFFGDTVESLREFKTADQLSIRRVEKICVLPVEAPVAGADAAHEQGRRQLKGTIFEYIGAEGIVALDESDAIKDKLKEERPEDYGEDEEVETASQHSSHLDLQLIDGDFVRESLERSTRLELSSLPLQQRSGGSSFNLVSSSVSSFRGRFSAFIEQLKEWIAKGCKIILVSHNEYQAQRMKALLGEYDLGARIYGYPRELNGDYDVAGPFPTAPLAICVGTLSSGFELPAAGLVVVTEVEVFGAVKRVQDKSRRKTGKFVSDFRDLKVGDYVVHVDYGIGRYLGMFSLDVSVNGRTNEFLKIQYAGGEYLYVPVESLNFVQKYMGSGDGQPQLDRLGSSVWKRRKAGVKESVRKLARELLSLYAAREVVDGYAYSPDQHWHQEFDSAFEYEETPDQLKAIEEVKADMERPSPMDRLICGDVGYGKTEVAMRASFKAVMDSKQVAVLVPTTILAQQHYNTFSGRLKPYPVNVEVLSRFKSTKEQKAIIEGLARGSVDVVIGTHRLLQRDIKFKNLGLVVVDEEQRFGVRHKEKLKNLRNTVDVLTLTATPIPRTLHLSLMGVRDLSIIETPPDERISIDTHLVRFSDQVIRKAILKEVERGGQIYFVHNRVQSIEAMRKYLRRVVPEVKVGVAHGQLWGRSLEDTMVRFLNREFDVLLATSIIESGLDIPSVNTILINRADRFGLAQLYQLRGRVGRDKYQAHAYLLIPAKDSVTELARRRLKAIQELTELGSGFRLATRDMEIRGAGNILGAEQSGHIAAVGFDLYCRLIEETIQEIKGEEYQEEMETEMELGYQGIIPQDYVSDTNLRLMIYKRLSSLRELEELRRYERELEDRYGKLPRPMKKLMDYFEIKIMAGRIRLERLKMEDDKCLFTFHESTSVDPVEVIELVKRKGEEARFVSDKTVEIKLHSGLSENAFIYLKKELQNFINQDSLNREHG